MMKRLYAVIGMLTGILFPLLCRAYAPTNMNTDFIDAAQIDFSNRMELSDIVGNIIEVAKFSILPVATAVFVYGCFLVIISMQKDEVRNEGKQYIIGSIVGVIIVVGAEAIFNIVMYFIY